jgi:hypothetical protein
MKQKKFKKIVVNGEKLLNEAWHDPLVQEYFESQKRLFKSTLNKAIKNAKKKIDEV